MAFRFGQPFPTQSEVEIACLLWGDKYSPLYVERLRSGLRRLCQNRFPFVCYTDKIPDSLAGHPDIEFRICANDWPGWWQKINLFDKRLTPRRYVVFIDLDVVILKSIDPILRGIGNYEFVFAEDPLACLSSSFMMIDVKSRFADDVVRHFDPRVWARVTEGDQDYLSLFIQPDCYRLQALPCSAHYSYKCLIDFENWASRTANPRYQKCRFEKIRMLNFHGFPKPHHLLTEPKRWAYADLIVKAWSEVDAEMGKTMVLPGRKPSPTTRSIAFRELGKRRKPE